MLKKKVFCSILACLLLFCCLSVHTVALELDEPVVDSAVARATSQFSVEIPANGFRYVRTTFPMEYGEVVSIRAVLLSFLCQRFLRPCGFGQYLPLYHLHRRLLRSRICHH